VAPVLSGVTCAANDGTRVMLFRFVERMLTANETCRQNEVNVLDHVTRAMIAHRRNAAAPRLLPVS
jgi:hypothetical protein